MTTWGDPDGETTMNEPWKAQGRTSDVVYVVADAEERAAYWPVPYRLTPQAEALLDEAEAGTEAGAAEAEPEAGT